MHNETIDAISTPTCNPDDHEASTIREFGAGINLDQLYEQAKAIRSDVSVNITVWRSAAGREKKFYIFTDDDAFLSSTPEGVLDDLLASVKTKQVA